MEPVPEKTLAPLPIEILFDPVVILVPAENQSATFPPPLVMEFSTLDPIPIFLAPESQTSTASLPILILSTHLK